MRLKGNRKNQTRENYYTPVLGQKMPPQKYAVLRYLKQFRFNCSELFKNGYRNKPASIFVASVMTSRTFLVDSNGYCVRGEEI